MLEERGDKTMCNTTKRRIRNNSLYIALLRIRNTSLYTALLRIRNRK
jgi:hypothetical protein